MVNTYIEREVKLDAGNGFVMPELSEFLDEAGQIEVIDQQLRTRYFDTEARDLLRAAMTLRHRSGEAHEGWQLKVPHARAREEIRADGHEDEVPQELRALLFGVTRGAALQPLALLTTERRLHRLRRQDGEPLVEVADDRVQATAFGAPVSSVSWREIEVELINGDEKLSDAIVKRLRKAGARRSASASKLSRAMDMGTTSSAGAADAADAVRAYAVEQHRAIVGGDVGLRRGKADVVHPTRVAVRRLRSMLRSYAALFEEGSTQIVEQELKWFAELLGHIRDRQVLRQRLSNKVDDLPPELVIGPVKSHIETELAAEEGESWTRLRQELDGPRYLELLTRLADWTAAPAWSKKATKPVSYLAGLARHTDRKVTRLLSAAAAAGDAEALHRARKAAKRARYAYELLHSATESKAARKKAKHHLGLQDLIGEYQDSRVSADTLRRIGTSISASSAESGFTFGVLYQGEQYVARSVCESAAKWSKRMTSAPGESG